MNLEFSNLFAFVLFFLSLCIFWCPLKGSKKYFVHLHLFEVKKGLDKEKIIVFLILILMVVALAEPFLYENKVESKKKGRDLVVVLDSSGSMSESGFSEQKSDTSKFDIIKEVLGDFIKKRGDDNIGVVIFGTYAFASSPLTYDMQALRFMLHYIEPGLAGENTAIGDGLHQALELLKKSHAKKKVIILLSDGFQNSGTFSIKQEVQRALQNEVVIYTIGHGKEEDFDKNLLQKIADQSGGKYFHVSNQKDLQEVYDTINTLEPSPIRSPHYLNKKPLFHLFVLAALALLFYLIEKRRKKVLAL